MGSWRRWAEGQQQRQAAGASFSVFGLLRLKTSQSFVCVLPTDLLRNLLVAAAKIRRQFSFDKKEMKTSISWLTVGKFIVSLF